MRIKSTLIFLGITSSCNAQILSIPDSQFKAKLLQADITNDIAKNINGSSIKIDANNNNEIEQNEVLAVYQLQIQNISATSPTKISDLTGLNAFSNLKVLVAFNNAVTNADVSPLVNLEHIDFTNNLLNSINLNGLLNLKRLNCSYNNLVTLNITGLSNLQILDCGHNQIANLDLSNKPELIQLEARNNNISTLDVSSLIKVNDFVVNDNPISVLDLSMINKIGTLQCMHTNVSVVDVSNQTGLTTLLCGNNPNLERIFMKNGSVESGLNLENLPNLKYVCVDEWEMYTIQQHVNINGSTNCSVNTYCSFNPGGTYFVAQGSTKYDFNNDGCGITDPIYPNMKFNVTNQGGYLTGVLIGNSSGNYGLPVLAGTHTLTPILENPAYFTVNPSSATFSFPSMVSPQTQNFCVIPNGVHNDLEINVIPLDGARPGFDAHYKIIYKNKGNQTQSGLITLQFNDAVLDFMSSVPGISNQVPNILSWNFSNIQPFETRVINFVLNLNASTEVPPLNLGDILNFNAHISDNSDETPQDNTSVLNQNVVNAFDPNDKTCLEGNIISQSSVGGYVHYLIRFENNGTANAQNILVKDIIDGNKFDINSLIPIGGSHDYETKITGTKVEFIFQGINLPFDDANNDGYVIFKIKVKPTLLAGESFANMANIYFDYNFPIETNNYVTTVQNSLGIKDTEFKTDIAIYPNPVKDVLIFKTSEKLIKIEIYDLAGRIVRKAFLSENKIDINDLKSGNYIIKVYTKEASNTLKLIKK
ncbi:T9SS type A sorting domain-containing protein [Chryseobacterium sp. ISL-6]|uniref:T9SS type A sorting domain-containing protein n=1 Tax=Chryseobacterium sp. ISL-6 TaxID=2819143 RepID=UPI001BE5142B|nr:T9SS type A sorting domain-containing protein [Chryseobacterium sp. ISL-6]MBT2621525.1 T9SS type A sorting domain-containing protein [Chryseobacterium sp. ISL-6]